MNVELTESGFVETNHLLLQFCQGLKEKGMMLFLDDFGTGYSNFQYLYDLKPDTIKIDKNMTKKALHHCYENLLLKHMIDLAHDIGSKICIEGIETEEELNRIVTMKIDFIQGYYFGKPCSMKEIMKKIS